MTETETLFQKYGGVGGVSAIVHALYTKIKMSELLVPYFENVDMERLIHHQTQFFSSIMGGPVVYSGRQLEAVHQSLNISDEAFTEVAELLRESLEDCDVYEDDIEAIMELVANTRPLIVQSGRN